MFDEMRPIGASTLFWLAAVGGCSTDRVVQPPPTPVAMVSLAPHAASRVVGETFQIVATVKNSAGDVLPGYVVRWSSSDTAIATVSTTAFASNTTGFVTPKAAGTATITAIVEGKQDAAFLSVPAPWAGAAHYVDAVSGSDTNSGTSAAPWQTIQHAADVLTPGDTAMINDGVYTGGYNVVDINRSGSAAAWLVFRSAHPWGAVIDGQNNASTTGIEITGAYVRVEGFEIRNTSRYGIDAELSHDVVVSQNHVHDIGHVCTDSKDGIVGIDAYDDNLVIERNAIHDIGRLGPGEQGCQPTDTYWQNHDHGIYHGVGNNVVIRNNVFYHLAHGWAVQRFDSSGTNVEGVTIVNNTFVGANPWRTGQVLVATATTDLLIANNIFYEPTAAGVWFQTKGLTNVTLSNNLTTGGPVSTGDSSGVTFSSNLDNANPQFVNVATFDFHVQSGSPAVSAGLRIAIVPDDADGYRRNALNGYTLGAYQYH